MCAAQSGNPASLSRGCAFTFLAGPDIFFEGGRHLQMNSQRSRRTIVALGLAALLRSGHVGAEPPAAPGENVWLTRLERLSLDTRAKRLTDAETSDYKEKLKKRPGRAVYESAVDA